jgi:hypothetical protein
MPVGADPVTLNWNALARKSVDAPVLALRVLPSSVEDWAAIGALAANFLRCSCFCCFVGSMGITTAIACPAYSSQRCCEILNPTVIQRVGVTALFVFIHSASW